MKTEFNNELNNYFLFLLSYIKIILLSFFAAILTLSLMLLNLLNFCSFLLVSWFLSVFRRDFIKFCSLKSWSRLDFSHVVLIVINRVDRLSSSLSKKFFISKRLTYCYLKWGLTYYVISSIVTLGWIRWNTSTIFFQLNFCNKKET